MNLGDDIGKEIKPLILQYDIEIKELLNTFQDVGDIGTKFDELFVLRYLLSHEGNVENAKLAIHTGIQWRKDNLNLLKAKSQGKFTTDAEVLFDFFHAKAWCGALGELGHPVFMVRSGIADIKAMTTELTDDEIVDSLLIGNEVGFQLADKKTRESGKFVKVLTVMDGQGLSVLKVDRRFLKCIAKSSNKSAEIYPQLLGKMILVNIPSTLRFVMKIMDKLQNKRVREKRILCGAKHTLGGDFKKCPFLSSYQDYVDSSLPDFLGGQSSTFDQLMVPYVQRSNIQLHEISPKSTTTLSANVEGPNHSLLLVVYGDVLVKCESNGNDTPTVNHRKSAHIAHWIPKGTQEVTVVLENPSKHSIKVYVQLETRKDY